MPLLFSYGINRFFHGVAHINRTLRGSPIQLLNKIKLFSDRKYILYAISSIYSKNYDLVIKRLTIKNRDCTALIMENCFGVDFMKVIYVPVICKPS